jgi:IS30 family transposase
LSHQTIYRWLATEAPELRVHLRRGRRRRRQEETRGRIPNCVRIEGRPKSVDAKRRYGDWEGDTVVSPGRRSGLVTMVERKSQYLRVRKTTSLKSLATMRTACRGLGDLPQQLRRTMTLDNGKEFAQHRVLTDRLGLGVYFAKPYASWQRGLNENTMGCCGSSSPNEPISRGSAAARWPERKNSLTNVPEKPRIQNAQRTSQQETRCI